MNALVPTFTGIRELFSMIVVMEQGATAEQIRHMAERVESLGLKAHIIQGTERTVIAALGEKRDGAKQALETCEGVEKVVLKLPSIVTTDLRLNEPRYASLPNIMKAKKKPIDEKTPEAYGVDIAPRLEVLKTTEPAGRKAGVKVKTVGELVDKLKNEMGLI